MMSAPKTAAPAALVGNIAANKVTSNQQAVPVPWFAGRRWLPLIQAQSAVYNPKPRAVTQKVGKSKQITGYDYFGSVFGITSCVVNDLLEAIEVAGKVVWAEPGGIERDVDHPHHTGDIVVPGVGTFRYHWGTEDAPHDVLILDGCGEDHPEYYGFSRLEVLDLYFGNNNSTPPTIRVLAERAARFDGLDENRTREGANPVTALAEVLEDDWFGLGQTGIVDVASWAALATAIKRETPVAVPGDPDHVASMGYLSPFLDRTQSARTFIAQVLEHFDGWLRPSGATLEIGQFPHDGATPVGLPELSYHDFVDGKRPQFSPGDDTEIVTDVTIVHLDRDTNMEEAATPVSNPAASARVGETRAKTFRRPFIHTTYQSREQGNQLTRWLSREEEACAVSLRRERIVGLHAGDRFLLVDAPSASSQFVRITQRADLSDGGEVPLMLVLERGLAPVAYVAPPNAEPTLPSPDLVTIVHARAFQLPTLFADYGPAPAVVVLAERPAAHTAGFTAHFSVAGVTYDQIATVGSWALRATLAAGILAGAATFTVNAAGFDLELLAAQSDAAKDDDTLLLVCGFELMSIGDVTALGGGQYSLTVFRGRRGSVADAHAGAAECFIIPRENLQVLQHADFPRTIATRYFKLASYDNDDEQDLAAALAINLVFDDTTVDAPGTFTALAKAEAIFISWTYPAPPDDSTIIATDMWELAAAVAPNPLTTPPTWSIRGNGFNRGGLAVGAHKYYYALNRDQIGTRSALAGPVDATALAAATGPAGPAGANGTNGADGAVGPGLVYVGAYNGANVYYKTSERTDIVSYGGNYYPAANAAKSGLATWGAPGGADWGAAFTNFKAVATDLLLTVDATILKTLVMGDGVTSNAGLIRSAGATAHLTGTGFWLGYDGTTPKFRVGNPSSQFFSFDGTNIMLRVGTGAEQTYIDNTQFLFGDPSGYQFLLNKVGSYIEAGVLGFIFGDDASGGWFSVKASGGSQMLGFDVGTGKLKFTNDADAAWYRSASGTLKTDGKLEVDDTTKLNGNASFGGDIRKISGDGWTVPLNDGDNTIAWKWDAGVLKVKIDATEFTVTIT